MNRVQKAVRWAFSKAVGFPVWNTTAWPWPGGASAFGMGGAEAIDLAAVYGCCRVLCQTEGSVPFNVFREDPKTGVRTKAVDHWSYPILHDTPNAYMTSMEFREAMVLGYCLFGNGYAEVVRLGKRVVSLNPLRADRMRVRFKPPDYNQLVYTYSHLNGKAEDYLPEQIIHLKNFSLDGLTGISPIRKHIIEHGLEAQRYGLNFFKNGGRPSGILSFKGKRPANDETANKVRADWQAIHGGAENAGKTAVVWDDASYEAITIPPEDAQYILTRQLSMAEIAGGIYGVPLNMLGATDKTATYASAEQFDIQFVKHTIRPLAVRLEQAINQRLFATEPDIFCELDLDGLQRGDSMAQATYFSTLTQNGIMNRNEARRKLNLPEVAGADELTVQVNLTPLDQLAKATNVNSKKPGDATKPTEPEGESQ